MPEHSRLRSSTMAPNYSPTQHPEGYEGSFGNPNGHHVKNGAQYLPEVREVDSMLESVAPVKIILPTGDVIVEYACPNRTLVAGGRWQVSSDDLRQNSPYFRALLDPLKFYEGRQFSQQKSIKQETAADTMGGVPDSSNTETAQTSLPSIRLPSDHFSSELGVDAIEMFLRILSFDSFGNEEKDSFTAELRLKPTSLVARLIELADAFNSPDIVREALTRSAYAFGKSKSPLWKFDVSILKHSEDRIRQTMYISRFLNERNVFQISSHTLILLGSRFWAHGIETPLSTTFRWRHLSDGLEEELYYRRQCILNTITDLQASFLRAYGALDTPEDMKQASTTTVPTRHYQCRCGFGNASACDAFHLGQMTRFFSLRTRTIFLGSTLIDPDFHPDVDSDGDEDTPPAPPSDISALISSLKQFPDYQIDTHHTGCGVRRRFLPPLDCIERFVGDSRGLLGVDLRSWDATEWPLAAGSWANRAIRRALVVDVHFSRINAIHRVTPGLSRPDSAEENARLLFTAKRRNWEA
ncbi:hypothetical protein BDV59DRAFT_177062 [Aspergillus ambiguus]|uniref:uncharacterized protein n=1 Tax=Aspergillus ambiguus TaxID=176160 RepID=UPI003CCD9B76